MNLHAQFLRGMVIMSVIKAESKPGRDISYCLDANYSKGTNTTVKSRRQLVMEIHTIAYSKSHRDNGVIQARGKIDDEANTLSTGDGCTNQSTGNYVFTKEEPVNPKVIGTADVNRAEDNWNGPRDGYQIYDKESVSPALRVTQPGNVRIVEDQPIIRIRKLTPVECERLQGYPDNHTKFGRRANGEVYEMSNTQRYKMCGNGISSPVPAFLFPAIFGTDEYEILDLFSGCHGTGLLLPPNFKTVAFAEIDKYASDVLRYHNPDIPNLGSVTEIVNRTDVPNFNMLVGGFPCQSWSIAGLRKGFDDQRGQLIYNVFDIIRKYQPKAIVLENVKGLLSKDNGDAFEAIMEYLSSLGSDLDFEVVNSKHFGLSQNRERVFIFGKLK